MSMQPVRELEGASSAGIRGAEGVRGSCSPTLVRKPRRRSPLKKVFLSAAVTLALSLSFSLLATNAQAAYSGYVYRTFCPNGSLQANWGQFAGYWGQNGSSLCGIKVIGVPASGYFVNTAISIPYESPSTVASNGVDVWLSVVGANYDPNNVVGQMCAQTFAFDELGNIASSSANVCTSGTSMTYQWLHTTVNVPALGTVVTSVSGEAWTRVLQSILAYNSSGS
jgi:hypothetical protein